VNDETSFIPELLEFHRRGAYWPRCREAVEWPHAHHLRGLEVRGMLPATHEAMAHYARHGLIHHDFNLPGCLRRTPAQVGVWQGLADEDPDVDAIYRLTDGSPTYFDSRAPVALAQQVVAPFNSQNTQFRKECFPLLYLPTSVTFRFTDILRGLVAQPILWAAGFQVGFTNATVVQKRNPRSPMIDFESEIPMYLKVEAVVEAVSGTVSRERSMCDNLFAAYEALLREGVVADGELTTLEAWLDDLRRTA